MGWIRTLIAAGVGTLSVIATPALAQACTCFGESTLFSPAGAEHPSGAGLVFASTCGGSIESWSVTVDGVPATLTRDQSESAEYGFGVDTVAITPTPAQGAEVVLSVDCDAVADGPGCGDQVEPVERARFVIVAPDTVAPPPIEGVVIDTRAGEFETGCGDPARDFRVDAAIEPGAIEPGTWLEVVLTRDGEAVRRIGQTLDTGGVPDFAWVLDRSELDGAEVCVRATVLDATGNASASQSDCTQIDAEGEGGGCACTPARPGDAAPLGLLAVAWFWRRRRDARTTIAAVRTMA